VTSQITAVVLNYICKFNIPTAIEDEFTPLYRKQIKTRKIKSKNWTLLWNIKEEIT